MATLSTQPTSLNYGDVAATTSLQFFLHVKNNSATETVHIDGATTTNSNFVVDTSVFPKTLPPNAPVLNIPVTFNAPATAGLQTGTLEISSDADNAPNPTPLSGNSVLTGTKALAIDPSSWIFPPTKVGKTSDSITVTVKNTGSGTVNVTVQIPVLNAAFVSTDLPTSATVLAAGASFTFHVAFKPLGAGYIVVPNGISITSDAPSSPNLVQLEGNGVLIDPAYIVVGGRENGFIAFGKTIQQFNTSDFNVETDAFMERQMGYGGIGYECELARVEMQYDDMGGACIDVRDTNEREETRNQEVPIGQLPIRRIRQQLADIKLTGELHTVRFTVLEGPLSLHAWVPRWVPAGETKKVPNLTGCGAPPTITSGCPSSPRSVGVAFSFAFMATGGLPPYTWSLLTGPLPPGLTLSSAGVLSGTPTTAGTFPYTVKVTDAANRSATINCSLVIVAGPVITSGCPVGPLHVGVAFMFSFTASGGIAPLTWSLVSGPLPPGLSLASSGALTGTPTTPGTFPYVVKVTDAGSAFATISCSIDVLAAPPLFTPCPGFSTVIGIAVDRTQLVQAESNFIIPLEITDTRLKDIAHGGAVTNANAFDVRPSQQDCTMLGYELEDGGYDPVLGKIIMHVRLPAVNGPAATSNTLFKLNIGNASITTDGSSAAIWSDIYQNVAHLNKFIGTPGTGGVNTTRESTALGLNWNGSNVPATGTGQIGNGMLCTPAQLPDLRRPELIAQPCVGVQPFTAEAWIQTSAIAYQYICGKVNFTACDVGATAAFWYMAVNASGKLETIFRNQGWSVSMTVTGGITIADGLRHHVKVTRNNAGLVTLMVDAVVDTFLAGAPVEIIDGGGNMEIGTIGFGHCGNYFNGTIDEIRTKNNQADSLNRTIDEYRAMKNVKNPSSFYILDPTS